MTRLAQLSEMTPGGIWDFFFRSTFNIPCDSCGYLIHYDEPRRVRKFHRHYRPNLYFHVRCTEGGAL